MSRVTTDNDESETTEEVMGLTEFLRKNPQQSVITKILKTYYGSQIMTETEWNQTLTKILNKKITH